MNATETGIELETVRPLHWVAIGLALISAVVHLVYGAQLATGTKIGLGVSFLLAAGGFIGAIVLFLIDYRRKLLYLVGIPYTGIQIVLWVDLIGIDNVLKFPSGYSMIDKPAQVLLIIVLIVLYAQER